MELAGDAAMSLLAIAGVMMLGALGGMFGALLGLGGGVFLVPALTLGSTDCRSVKPRASA